MFIQTTNFQEILTFRPFFKVIMMVWVAMSACIIPATAHATPIKNPINGHYYEAIIFSGIVDSLDWNTALIDAQSRNLKGQQGYLATITSKEENDFLITSFAPVQSPRGEFWIGGSDEPVDGLWRWVVGPEAGTLFWIGDSAGTEIVFADWTTGEPNNAFGPASESRLGWLASGWNDLPTAGFGSLKPGYIVEFNNIPSPATLHLFSMVLLGLGLILQKTRR